MDEKEKLLLMAESLAEKMRGLPSPVIWTAATLAAGEHPVLELACTLAKAGKIEELVEMLIQRETITSTTTCSSPSSQKEINNDKL